MKVALVIPAYKAGRTLGAVLSGIPGWVDQIIVVDDGSQDATASVARDFWVKRSGVTVAEYPYNRGVGAAMIAGYHIALRDGADVVVKMDADGQMDPGDLPGLLVPIRAHRADYTKGDRTGRWRGMPASRRRGVKGLAWLLGVADPVNGYTAITRNALERIDWRRIHPRFGFEITMLFELRRLRLRVEHVPMPARYGAETSYLSAWRFAAEFPLLLWRYWK